MKTLKKIFTVIMILSICTTVLAGCKINKVDSTEATSNVDKSADIVGNTSADPSASNSTDSNTNSSGKVIKQGTIQKDGNIILKELAFVYNGNTIAISDIAGDEKLEGILGKAIENKSHTYSSDDGKNMDNLIGFTEKQYKFPGLDIKTINAAEKKEFFIFSIKITDPKYSTVRNIRVGDSLEKLEEAYPEGNLLGGGATQKEDDFQYHPVNYVDGMQFHIKNNKIESIMMYTLLD